MNILEKLFPSNTSPRFITKKKFEDNLAYNLLMTPRMLQQLREQNIADTTELELKFSFHTNSEENAAKLHSKLKEKNYSVERKPLDNKVILITGQTSPIKMDGIIILEWIKQMSEIGYEFDSSFNGWGIDPQQKM